MKAIRWYARGDVRYEEVAEPSPGPGQVKAKIHYSGICGSDLHEYESGPIFISLTPHPLTGCVPPVTLGHEFSGRVVEVGEGVTSLAVGDRVTGDATWSCGKCYYCMRNKPALCTMVAYTGLNVDGCMAEYLVAPDYSFYKLPESVSDELGTLLEPLEGAFHCVRQGKVQVGDTVAIVGAGPIGCCTILAARAAGASKIYVWGKHKGRREKAMSMGATTVLDPADGDPVDAIRDFTNGLGADVTFDCAGRPDSPILALRLARKAGTVVIMGVFSEESPKMHFNDVVFGERNIVGSLSYAGEAPFILGMMAEGIIDPSQLITGKVELKDTVEKGFKQLLKNKDVHLKILIESPNWS